MYLKMYYSAGISYNHSGFPKIVGVYSLVDQKALSVKQNVTPTEMSSATTMEWYTMPHASEVTRTCVETIPIDTTPTNLLIARSVTPKGESTNATLATAEARCLSGVKMIKTEDCGSVRLRPRMQTELIDLTLDSDDEDQNQSENVHSISSIDDERWQQSVSSDAAKFRSNENQGSDISKRAECLLDVNTGTDVGVSAISTLEINLDESLPNEKEIRSALTADDQNTLLDTESSNKKTESNAPIGPRLTPGKYINSPKWIASKLSSFEKNCDVVNEKSLTTASIKPSDSDLQTTLTSKKSTHQSVSGSLKRKKCSNLELEQAYDRALKKKKIWRSKRKSSTGTDNFTKKTENATTNSPKKLLTPRKPDDYIKLGKESISSSTRLNRLWKPAKSRKDQVSSSKPATHRESRNHLQKLNEGNNMLQMYKFDKKVRAKIIVKCKRPATINRQGSSGSTPTDSPTDNTFQNKFFSEFTHFYESNERC